MVAGPGSATADLGGRHAVSSLFSFAFHFLGSCRFCSCSDRCRRRRRCPVRVRCPGLWLRRARLRLWILRLCALCLCALRLLWRGLVLQWHLYRRRPLVPWRLWIPRWLRLWPRLRLRPWSWVWLWPRRLRWTRLRGRRTGLRRGRTRLLGWWSRLLGWRPWRWWPRRWWRQTLAGPLLSQISPFAARIQRAADGLFTVCQRPADPKSEVRQRRRRS